MKQILTANPFIPSAKFSALVNNKILNVVKSILR